MSPVPDSLKRRMAPFVALFTRPTWRHVLVLVAGALLTPGRRTVTAALSIMGQRKTSSFANFHRVLNRNRWSVHAVAQRLLMLLIATFVQQGPVVTRQPHAAAGREPSSVQESALGGAAGRDNRGAAAWRRD